MLSFCRFVTGVSPKASISKAVKVTAGSKLPKHLRAGPPRLRRRYEKRQ
jgi:hypothetical protein